MKVISLNIFYYFLYLIIKFVYIHLIIYFASVYINSLGSIHFTFLSDEGPSLETLNFVFHISAVQQPFYISVFIFKKKTVFFISRCNRGQKNKDESKILLQSSISRMAKPLTNI